MSLLGCLVITEGYIVAYLATNLQKESYTIIATHLSCNVYTAFLKGTVPHSTA